VRLTVLEPLPQALPRADQLPDAQAEPLLQPEALLLLLPREEVQKLELPLAEPEAPAEALLEAEAQELTVPVTAASVADTEAEAQPLKLPELLLLREAAAELLAQLALAEPELPAELLCCPELLPLPQLEPERVAAEGELLRVALLGVCTAVEEPDLQPVAEVEGDLLPVTLLLEEPEKEEEPVALRVPEEEPLLLGEYVCEVEAVLVSVELFVDVNVP
jgi:hypothetical protein